MVTERTPVYVEPLQAYLARKHFYIGLASSSLLLLLVVDVHFLTEMTWTPATYAFHAILLGVAAVLLFMERHVWRYRRFRIYEDGFVLAGHQSLRDGGRFVRFSQNVSAEAGAAVEEGSRKRLLYLTIRLQPRADISPGSGLSPEEVVITREELRHRNIVQLWREFVARGLGKEDALG